MSDRDELVDESVLRRSLRFEADERVPRFDAAAIAALAAAEPLRPRTALYALVAAGVTGLVAVGVWSTIIANAGALAMIAGEAILDLLIATARLLVGLAEAVSEPAVPISLLAALGFAIVHELRERRESAHVHAS